MSLTENDIIEIHKLIRKDVSILEVRCPHSLGETLCMLRNCHTGFHVGASSSMGVFTWDSKDSHADFVFSNRSPLAGEPVEGFPVCAICEKNIIDREPLLYNPTFKKICLTCAKKILVCFNRRENE